MNCNPKVPVLSKGILAYLARQFTFDLMENIAKISKKVISSEWEKRMKI